MKIHGVEVSEGFAFSRWGDGEWKCILEPNSKKHNADKHHYFESLSDALKDVLTSYNDQGGSYMLGMLELAREAMGSQIDDFLGEKGLEINWVDAEVWHKSVYAGDWQFYYDLLSTKHLYVGPGYLRSVFRGGFVEVPSFDCWRETSSILDQIRSILKSEVYDVIGFSSGMPSKVWIDCLKKEGVRPALIDYGSVFDPLGGVKSRKYHKNKDYQFPKV